MPRCSPSAAWLAMAALRSSRSRRAPPLLPRCCWYSRHLVRVTSDNVSFPQNSGSSWNRVGKFEGLKGRKARYFRDLLHFCLVQNLAQMLDGKDIETSSAALGYVFI